MELLILTYNPSRASFTQRIGNYLDVLRANGMNCEVIHYPRDTFARHGVLKRSIEFDAVYLQKKTLNWVDALWLRRYARNVIFDFDDAVMYYDDNPQRKPSRRKHTKPFERTVRLARLVIAGNSYLAEHAKQFNPNVEVLPTGLDTGAYYESQAGTENDGRIRLVWIGSKSTLEYLAEIKPALEELGSRHDDVVLRIICDEFFALRNMPVERCTWSIETQVADLAASDIGLAPLPDNRFTRGKCGFKILQYYSVGLPVVASPVGVNAEYVRDGDTGFHATDISQWVDRVSSLIENHELRKQMGQAGIQFVQRFDLQVIGRRLVDLIKEHL